MRKKSSKDILKNKASASIALDNDGVDWKIHQYAKNKSVKYNIFKDGVDQQIKDINKCRAEISTAFPLDEENFFSQVYLSSYRPSGLLYGKATTRFEYFERVFDMRIYNLMHKTWLSELSKLNSKFTQRKLLDEQHEKLASQSTKDVSKKLKEIRQKHKDLLVLYKDLSNQLRNISSYVTIAKEIKSTDSINALRKERESKRLELRKLDKKINHMHEALGAQKELKQIRRTRKKLTYKLSRLTKVNLNKVDSKIGDCEAVIHKLEKLIEDYNNAEEYIKKYKAAIKELSGEPKDCSEALAQHEKQLNHLQHEHEQKSELKSGKPCPTCGFVIPKEFNKNLKQLETSISKMEDKIKQEKLTAFCFKVKEKIPDKIINLSLEATQTKLANARTKLKALDKLQKSGEDYAKIERQLKDLPREKKSAEFSKSLLRELQTRQKKFIKRLDVIKEDIKLKEKLADLDQADITDLPTAQKRMHNIQGKLEKISPALEAISDQMQNLAMRHTEHKMTTRQLQEVDDKINELNEALANRDIVEELSKAYSSKGIRIMQIKSLADAYVSGLNELSGSIYAEPVKFYSDVDTNNFNIIAERSGQIGDIRSLCGSESRQFLCISAVSQRRLMPNHLRCSHIILDEMEAGLSAPDRQIFCNEFLPTLASSVPHLVVVTPMSAKVFSPLNAVNKLLVRKNNVTNWGNYDKYN